jgi:ribosome-associated protein
MDSEERSPEAVPSKTQRKREMLALQQVGTRLTRFSEAQLDKLPLSEKLRTAIREFRRLPNSHGAKRRQLQYIGRLMRDFNLDEIEQAIEFILQPPRRVDTEDAVLQRYCEQILLGGDTAINALLSENPQLERQVLRKLYLDFSKAHNRGDDSRRSAVKSKLRDYLQGQLD